jgi:hypothetical protein
MDILIFVMKKRAIMRFDDYPLQLHSDFNRKDILYHSGEYDVRLRIHS